MQQVLAHCSASISELKKNPTALLNEAGSSPIVILNHNVPSAYLVPAETYEYMMEMLDDQYLAEIIQQRQDEKNDAIAVDLDDL